MSRPRMPMNGICRLWRLAGTRHDQRCSGREQSGSLQETTPVEPDVIAHDVTSITQMLGTGDGKGRASGVVPALPDRYGQVVVRPRLRSPARPPGEGRR